MKINPLMAVIAMQLFLIGFTVNSVGIRITGKIEDSNVAFPALILIGLAATFLLSIRELNSMFQKKCINNIGAQFNRQYSNSRNQLDITREDVPQKCMVQKYFKFEMGLSGTGLETAEWRMSINSQSEVRAVIGVIVSGMFDTKDSDSISSRYLKVSGESGSIQWASKKISNDRPDILTCVLPIPFSEEVND
jgi:hypothetical protein|tara:strand:+ start:23139 stop:23714 length:576 start_codon:yes stop_codon:yes gene_type:complete